MRLTTESKIHGLLVLPVIIIACFLTMACASMQEGDVPDLLWNAAQATEFGNNSIVHITYGDGRWVAVSGSFGVSMGIWYSDNGQTWQSALTQGNSSDFLPKPVLGGGRWIVAGGIPGVTGIVSLSDDGIEWRSFPVSIFPGLIAAVAYGNGRWIGVGDCGLMAYSDDGGETWALLASRPFGTEAESQMTGIAFGDNRWVVVGSFGRIAYSDDNGETWVSVPNNGSVAQRQQLNTVKHENGRWVAVGFGGMIANSSDGIAWNYNRRTALQNHLFTGVAYGNGQWIAVGFSRSPAGVFSPSMQVSTDNGMSWVAVRRGGDTVFSSRVGNLLQGTGAIEATGINGIAFGGNRWIAVGGSGRMAYILE